MFSVVSQYRINRFELISCLAEPPAHGFVTFCPQACTLNHFSNARSLRENVQAKLSKSVFLENVSDRIPKMISVTVDLRNSPSRFRRPLEFTGDNIRKKLFSLSALLFATASSLSISKPSAATNAHTGSGGVALGSIVGV
jgi:hypothetical protein